MASRCIPNQSTPTEVEGSLGPLQSATAALPTPTCFNDSLDLILSTVRHTLLSEHQQEISEILNASTGTQGVAAGMHSVGADVAVVPPSLGEQLGLVVQLVKETHTEVQNIKALLPQIVEERRASNQDACRGIPRFERPVTNHSEPSETAKGYPARQISPGAAEEDLAVSSKLSVSRSSKILGLGSKLRSATQQRRRQPFIPRGSVGKFVDSTLFEHFSALVIMANAGFIWYAADFGFKHLHNPLPLWIELLEIMFTIFYVFELCLRIAVYRSYFFCGSDRKWNMFDAIIVGFSVSDNLTTLSSGGGERRLNVGPLRVLRLLRMVKLMRVARLARSFHQLRLLIASIMGCMKTMIWSVMLIFMVSFMFAICFVQGTTAFLRHNNDIDPVVYEELNENWNSVSRAQFSLYLASFGGTDWKDMALSLQPVGILFFYLFMAYIGLWHCVMANAIASIFIEATGECSSRDHEAIIQKELEHKDDYLKLLQDWFDVVDDDHSGEITYDEFTKNMEAPQMLAFTNHLGIEVVDMQQFFGVLSSQGQRPVDLEAFVVGCIKLKGSAKSMDLLDLVYAHKRAVLDQYRFSTLCQARFDEIIELVREMQPHSKGDYGYS